MNTTNESTTHEACYYHKPDGKRIHCLLCPHGCEIAEGRAGLCGVRVNRNGVLYANSYGLVSSIGLDPIEKKPLYHFHPGSMILSIGSYGCNFRCAFCQNHTISTVTLLGANGFNTDERPIMASPAQIVALAQKYKPNGNIGVAYTYNEPLIGYEYVRDCALLACEHGLKNVIVTNGYVMPEPLRALLPLIDAFNVDLKAFTDAFYQRVGGSIREVTETITLAAEHSHVEVTTLVIPCENDSDAEINTLACFIASIDPDIPLHLSRFFPQYRMTDKPPTLKETMVRLKRVAEQHLRHVYIGNMR